MGRTRLDLAMCALLSGLLVVALPSQAQTQSGLSDALSKSIRGAKRSDSLRQRDEATRVYDEVLGEELDPTPAKRRVALKSRAAVYEKVNQNDRAEADYSAALALEPADPTDYIDRGYFRLRMGRYVDAITDFAAGSKLEPKNPRFRYAVGRVYAAMRNYPSAIEQYGQAIRIAPRDPMAFLSRAEANIHLKNYAEAQADYERAIKLGLKRPSERLFAHLGRGYVALVTDDFDTAVEDFDIALEIEPGAVNAWMWRGYANERLGRYDLALADYERAIMVEPDNATARSNLRRLRSRDGTAAQPDFQIDDRTRLAADSGPGLLPRRRPQM
ncbi:tetratricopeptide repeat protein [Xanthobacteraceae bacterium Astr-EGSB]|uniref:tetratricopeptide repeat protein n=1 Tax=Astrobacterium formosum TaxID=3069710 RepID=UPI0027B13B86|nr:tetratricopeptide repeat protein [Xanthobacteraceae bacterium Astr-EGSB]